MILVGSQAYSKMEIWFSLCSHLEIHVSESISNRGGKVDKARYRACSHKVLIVLHTSWNSLKNVFVFVLKWM